MKVIGEGKIVDAKVYEKVEILLVQYNSIVNKKKKVHSNSFQKILEAHHSSE